MRITSSPIFRGVAGALSALLLATGLVAGAQLAPALAATPLNLTANAPTSTIAGENVTIGLSATNPSSTVDVYNATYRYVLPAGVTYVPGSSTSTQGPVTLPVSEPLVVAINTTDTPPVLSHYVLVWENVSDLPAGATASLAFEVSFADPVGSSVDWSQQESNPASVYGNTVPRNVPDIDPVTGTITGDFDASATADPGTTTVSAIRITKSANLDENELPRGVHTQGAPYSLTVRITEQGDMNGITVVDYLPANLEFLCGPDHSTLPEYGGAPAIPTATCDNPASVETVDLAADVVDGLTAGVYTKVTWNIPAAQTSANATITLNYRAAVPLRENTMSWSGATPGTGGQQASNLDNNNGAPTRQPGDLDAPLTATNGAVATGDYLGADVVGDRAQIAETVETVEITDVSIVKSVVGGGDFVAGSTATFRLVVRTSEYATASDLVITDVLPDGFCPLVTADFTGSYPAGAPAGCSDATADAITGATMDAIVFDAATGEYTLTMTPADGTATTDAVLEVEYKALMLSGYSGLGVPTVAGDSFTNSVEITGTTSDITGTANPTVVTGVTENSSASLGTALPTISKRVAIRPESVVGTQADCVAIPDADYVSAPAGSAQMPIYQQGDRVCFLLEVNFSDSTQTRNAQIQDFVPSNLTLDSFTYAGLGAGDVVQTGPTDSPTFLLGTPVNPSAGAERFVPRGANLQLWLWGTVDGTEPTTTVDLNSNLMKYRQVDTEGTVLSLRTDADFGVLPPAMTLAKAVSATTARAGDVLNYTVTPTNTSTAAFPVKNVIVWDALPSQFQCSDVTANPQGATLVTLPPALAGFTGAAATRCVLQWTITDSLSPTAASPLTYSVTVPNGIPVTSTLINNASIVEFSSTNTAGVDARYFPESSLRTPPAPNVANTPAANATASVTTPGPVVVKDATPTLTTIPNKGATDVVAGEWVTYTYSVTVPRGATVYRGALSDVLPNSGATIPAGAVITATVRQGASDQLVITSPANSTGTVNGGTGNGAAGAGQFSLTRAGLLTFPTTYTNTSAADQKFEVTIQGVLVGVGLTSGTLTNTGRFLSFPQATGGTSHAAVEDTASVTVVAPALSVTKATNNSSPTTASVVRFTLTAQNAAGRPAAYDVEISDCLPAGLTYQAGTATLNGGTLGDPTSTAATGAWPGGNGCPTGTTKLAWTLSAPLVSGGSAAIAFDVKIGANAAGAQSYVNTARVQGSTLNNGANNTNVEYVSRASSNNVTINVPSAPTTKSIVSIAPGGTTNRATIGATVDYQVQVTVPANVNFYNAAIVDQLPVLSGARLVTVDQSAATLTCTVGATTTACGTTPTLTPLTTAGTDNSLLAWSVGTLAAAPEARVLTLRFPAVVRDIPANVFTTTANRTNTADLRWMLTAGATAPTTAAGPFDRDGADGTVSFVVREPQLSISKGASNSTPEPGQTFAYIITARNHNNPTAAPTDRASAAFNIVITDTVPAGVVVIPGTISPTPASTTTDGGRITSITWNVSTLAVNASTSFGYSATLAPSAELTAGPIINTATIDSYRSLNNAGRTYTGPSATATVTPDFPQVALSKTNTTAGALSYVDEESSFTLRLTNRGGGTASSVVPRDVLPENWTYVVGSARLVTTSAPVAVAFEPTVTTAAGVQTLQWPTLGELLPTYGASITYRAVPTALAATDAPGAGSTVQHINTLSAIATDPTGATGYGVASLNYVGAPATAIARISSADLEITKVAADEVIAGLTTNNAFTITVANTGADAAVGPFTVTDTLGALPAGVTAGVPTGTGWTCAAAAAPASYTCERSGSLAAGASFPAISVPLTVAQGVEIDTIDVGVDNSATVKARTYDPTTGNNTASDRVEISTLANLTVDKAAQGPFIAGQTATWTIVVSNDGPSLARYPIVIEDVMPTAGLDLDNVTISTPEGTLPFEWECTVVSGGAFTCDYGPESSNDGLATGASLPTITVTAPILPGYTGQLVNAVEATSQTPSDDPATDTATTTVSTATALTIDKQLVGEFTAGKNATYSFTVTNTGTPTATAVRITDALPTGLTFVSASGADWDCSATASGASALDCVLENSLPGTTAPTGDNTTSLTVVVRVASNVTGNVINTATVAWGSCATAPCTTTDSEPSIGTGIETDLRIVKATPAISVTAGTTVDYTITVTNLGASDSPAGIVVTDVIPEAFTYNSHTAPAGWDCPAVTTTFACTSTEALAQGDVAEFTITLNVPVDAGLTSVTNTATVAAAPGAVDLDLTNNSYDATVVVVSDADVTIAKTVVGDGTVSAGESVDYDLVITNAGPSIARTVSVSDTPPAGFTITGMDSDAWTCTVATGACASIAELPVGSTTIRVTADVASSVLAGTAVNSATVTFTDSTSAEPQTHTDTADVTVETIAELTLEKVALPVAPIAGLDDVTYTLSVGNNGPSDAAGPITITDVLPVGLTYASHSGAGWVCEDVVDQTIECNLAAGIGAGGTAAPLTIVTSSDAGIPTGTVLTNQANAWGPTDPSGADDTAPVTFGTVADLGITKTARDASLAIGDTAYFDIVITNYGPSAAVGVTVTDVLPAGLTYDAANSTPGAFSCDTTVECTFGNPLPVYPQLGSSVTLTIAATVGAAAYPAAVNTASVGATTPEPLDPEHANTDDATITVEPLVDLTPTKSVDPATLVTGEQATWTLTVTNNGPTEDPGGFALVDTLPGNLQYDGFVEVDGVEVTCAADPDDAQVITCTFADAIGVGESRSVQITTTTLPGTPATVVNHLEATSTFPQVGGDHEFELEVPVTVLAPDLTVAKSVEGAAAFSADPDATFGYEIVVTNGGTFPAYDAVVTDIVPNGVVVDAASILPAGGVFTAATADDPATITWTLTGPIAVDETVTLGYSATFAAAADLDGTALTNSVRVVDYRATADATGPTYGPSAPATADVTPLFPSLDLVKTATAGDVAVVGGDFGFTLSVTNAGPGSAQTATIVDTLPVNWEYVGTSAIVVAGVPYAGDLEPVITGTGAAGDPAVLTWTLGDGATALLAAGDTVTITLVVTPTADATTTPGATPRDGTPVPHVNTLDASATDTRGATGNESGPFEGTSATANAFLHSADLVIAKTSGSQLVAGTDIADAFNIAVSNEGPNPAASVVVTDTPTLPVGVTVTGAGGDGWTCGTIAENGAFTCERLDPAETLAPGASFDPIVVSVSVGASVRNGTAVPNSAAVSSTTFDLNTTNNSSSATPSVVALADLEVTKVASGDFTAGTDGSAAWTITVVNNGPSNSVAPITVSDTLPTELDLDSVEITPPAGWTCTVPDVDGAFECRLASGALAVGTANAAVFQVAATIPSDVRGSLTNAVTVDGTTSDTIPGNNSTDVTTDVDTVTVLDFDKVRTAPTGDIVPGSPVTYEFTVTNLGTPDAIDLEITDTLESGTLLTGFASDDAWTCTGTGTADALCTLASLPGGATSTVSITVSVPADFSGDLYNLASLTWTDGGPVTSDTTGPSKGEADLEIVKSQSAESVLAGTDHGYTLTVGNNGPSDIPADSIITITDVLPLGMSVVSAADADGEFVCETTGDSAAGFTVTCTTDVGFAAGAADKVIDIVVTVAPDVAPGDYTNTATVAGELTDPVPANNQSPVLTEVRTDAAVEIVKTVTDGATQVTAGTSISYTLEVTNYGPSIARDVSVVDTAPDGFTVTAVSSSDAAWSCDLTGCDRADLAADTPTTITVVALADSAIADGTPATNSATVEWVDTTDTESNRDTDTVDVTVVAVAELTLTKTARDTNPAAGENVVYDLIVGNVGPSDSIADITVTDVLPAGLRFVSVIGTDWSCAPAAVDADQDQTVTCVLEQGIALNGFAPTLTMVVSSDPTLDDATELTNTATATSPTDPDGVTTTETVIFGTAADLVLTKTALGDQPYAIGSTVEYAIEVTNDGPSIARDVVITDVLPAGLTFDADTSTTTGFTCTEGVPSTIECTLTGDLAVGASRTVTIAVLVDAVAYPTVDNTATATSSTPIVDATTATDTETITVLPLVDLQPTKEFSPETLVTGQQAEWTLTVVNNGPTEDPGGFSLVDELPATLEWVGVVGDPGPDVTTTVDGQTITFTFADALAVGSSRSVTFATTVLPGTPAEITNSVEAESLQTQVLGPHTDSVTAPVEVLAPALTVQKTVDDAAGVTVDTDATLAYDLLVTNTGSFAAYRAVVTDTVPNGLIVDQASIVGGVYTPDVSGTGGTIVWDLAGPIAPTESVTLSYTATLAPSADLSGSTLVNTAVVTSWGAQATGGPAYGESDPSLASVTPAFPDLNVTKATTGDTIAIVGQPLGFTLGATNSGSGTAQTVTFTDVLPVNWEYVAGSTVITIDGAPFAAASEPTVTGTGLTGDHVTIVWELADADAPVLLSGQAVALRYEAAPTELATADAGATTDGGTAVPHVNSASVAATDVRGAMGNGSGSYGAGPVTAEAFLHAADLSIVKTVGDPLVAGLTTASAFTLAVSNAGPDAATGIVVTDTPAFAEGITVVSAQGTGWVCTTPDADGAFSCERNAAPFDLAAGASFADEIVVTVAVDTAVAVDTVVENTASVDAATFDRHPENNSDTVSSTVTTQADLQLTKVANGAFAAGADASWTVTVTNHGPSASVAPITVTDILPAGVDAGSATIVAPDGWTCTTPGADGTFECDLATGTLAAGAGNAAVFTVSATIDSALRDPITNTASVVGTTPEPSPEVYPNEASVTTPVDTATLLTLSKRLVGEIVPGTPATYSFTVTNTGTADAIGLRVVDALEAGQLLTSFASDDAWTCTGVGTADAVCELASLQGGATTVVTITVSVPASAGDAIYNRASLTWTDGGPVTSSVNTVFTGQADLAVVKSQSVDTVIAGTQHEYELTVSNIGPSDSPVGESVRVVDLLPTGMTFVSGADDDELWSCSAVAQLVTCENTDGLEAGDEPQVITVTVDVASGVAAGGYANRATITGPLTDPVPANNASQVVTTVQTDAAVSIVKTARDEVVIAGGTADFDLTISNAGPSDARSLVITDLIPAGFTITGVTSADDGVTCTLVACELATLAAGAPATVITVEASVDAALAGGTIATNSATVTWVDTVDPAANTATDTADVTVETAADLTLSKTPDTQEVTAGAPVTFTLQAANAGISHSVGATTIVDTLPVGLRFASYSGSGWVCSPAAVGTDEPQTVTCVTPAGIAAGAQAAPLTLVASSDPSITAALTNEATVTSPNDTEGASDTAEVTFVTSADLAITKSHNTTAVAIGQTLDFQIVVSNAGTSSATGVRVVDSLPAGLSYVSSVGAGWTCADAAGEVTCDLTSTVLPGVTAPTLVIRTLVGPGAYPAVDNVAVVSSDVVDPNPDNNQVTDEVTVPPSVQLTVTKVHTGEVRKAANATYVITVGNEGFSEAPAGFSIVDSLPEGLRFVSATGDGASCSVDGQDVTCVFSEPLAVGETVEVRVTAFVLLNAADEVTNTVVAISPFQPENPTASDTAAVRTPPLIDTGGGLHPLLPNTGLVFGFGTLLLLNGLAILLGMLFWFIHTRRRRTV